MSRLKTVLLVANATHSLGFVCSDSAVQKAARQVGADIAQAGRSTAGLASEIGSAWGRSNSR
jgi:hypothetical protein